MRSPSSASPTISRYRASKMWRGRVTFGNSTTFGNGKSGIVAGNISIADLRLLIADLRLLIADCGLWIVDGDNRQLPISNQQSPISNSVNCPRLFVHVI